MKLIIQCSILAGTDIQEAVKEAIELAKEVHQNIGFNFNGINVFIMPVSVIVDVVEDYRYQLRRKQQKQKQTTEV